MTTDLVGGPPPREGVMGRFLTPEIACRAGRVLAVVSVIAAVAGFPLFVVGGGRLTGGFVLHSLVGVIVLAVPFWAIVRQQPLNLLVWALGWTMILFAGQVLTSGALAYLVSELFGREAVRDGLVALPEALPTSLVVLRVLADLIPIPALYLVSFALLVFPDGRLLSPRWRPVVGLFAVGLILEMTWFGVQSVRSSGLGANRADVLPEVEGAFGTVLAVANSLFLVATFLTIVSVVVRYRRSSTVERAQIRWVGAGVAAFAATQLLWFGLVFDLEVTRQLFWAASLVTFPAVLAGYCVAILRYRLYDIDVVISRSLVVAALAGFIAVVYVAVVVGVGTLVGADEANLGLQVVATAIVAVAFQPLRQRVRRWADRLVYGKRATPYEVLAGFSRHAANPGDEANLQRIAEVLAAGTGAEPATVWLRVGDQIWPAASSDASGSAPPVVMALRDGDLPELPASLVVPVRHDGELLGAVSLTKPRSEPPTRQDEELAVRLARGLSLVLRNARLTAELRAHLEALEASRSRLVRAQDEARRRIEGELRQGAQRQLVELKDLLDQARVRVGSGAVRTAALLEQLEHEAEDAIDTLRSLAQGIYPPVLEAEGLGPAVIEQARKSTLPVTAHAAGLPRYPPEIEIAVYFCVLEALQNAAKYAQATSVHVRLEQRDDGLWFEVSDDGVGFDPLTASHGSGLKGIAARLDTIDGVLDVATRPGTGTRITGHVPSHPHQPTPARPAPTTAKAPA
jgi:signal transduction histidine kinase